MGTEWRSEFSPFLQPRFLQMSCFWIRACRPLIPCSTTKSGVSEYTIPDVYQHDLQDSPTAHYPQRRFDWDSLKNGHNPSLNPYIFSGMPWMSEGPGAFVTSWPQLFMSTANAMDWTAWIHLLLAGLFMYFCAIQFGAGRLAAIFAGIVWTYNLHQVAWLEYPQHPGTQLWIPLLFGLNMALLKNGLHIPAIVSLIVRECAVCNVGVHPDRALHLSADRPL